jgi:peptidoglycan/LPS O-acetylase OafA/YrhL
LIGLSLIIITHRDFPSVASLAASLLFLNQILGLGSTSPVFWTLAIEFQFYLLLGLLYSYCLTSNLKSIITVLFLSVLGFWLTRPAQLIPVMPFFGVGIMIFHKKFTNMTSPTFWAVTVILLLIGVKTQGIPQVIAGLCAVLFLLYGGLIKESKIREVLIFGGTISYSLYLLHWEFGRSLVARLRYFPYVADNAVLRVLLGVIFSIFCAWILYIVVEKPSSKLSASVKYKENS